jgi:hypothetical protein
MWTSQSEQLSGGRGVKFVIRRDASAVSYSDVLHLWQDDEAFRAFFNSLLAEAPFTAFRWETPPVTAASVGRPFEFVLIDSPGLAQKPDRDAFAEHWRGTERDVVSFPNLGGDAFLVVPCPRVSDSAYGHLAAFVRGAPESQRHALWSLVGKVVAEQLGAAPLWLSTAGAGVSWLHVRLDRRPKYYGHLPYRDDTRPA